MVDWLLNMAGVASDWLAVGCIAIGGVLLIIGGLGIVRLPDVYARIHAAGVIDTGGAGLILLGLMFHSGWSLVTVKLIFIGIFMFITSPISGHAITQVAYRSNIKPQTKAAPPKSAKRKPAKQPKQRLEPRL